MKKRPIVFAAAVAALLTAAPAALFAMPRNVLEARNNAHDQGLVAGAGLSDARHVPTARNVATMEARAEIARELQVVVDAWQRLETAAFQGVGLGGRCEWTEVMFHSITETVARAAFPGSRSIYEYRAADGHYWVVVTISRAQAESTVANAAANAEAAAEANPSVTRPSNFERGRLANDEAQRRMREAFELRFGN